MTTTQAGGRRQGPGRDAVIAVALVAGVLLVAGLAWLWWPRPAAAPAPPAEALVAPAPAPAAPPATAPVETPLAEPKAEPAPAAVPTLRQAFIDLLGAQPVRDWLRLDDFARRFVATVDNLGRSHAPSMLWPVEPTGGRFTVLERDGHTVVDPDNQLRYSTLVQVLTRIDSGAAVTLYVRLLPDLQRAYEDLGYPGRRFHTRLMTVIDELLAAPEAPELIPVQLTEVRGSVPSLRPWVRYEFADPALENAHAGQKLMVRVGSPNERRLKAKLRELRQELVRRATP